MPQPKKKPAPSAPPAPDDVTAKLRERLLSSVTLTTERLQDAVDDAVRRGRMTRKDAEELLATLLSAGRTQTEQLLTDLEQLVGGSSRGDAVKRVADRARRKVGVVAAPAFPISDYDSLTAAQITKRLKDLSPGELRKVRDHERRHAKRKSVLGAVERKLG